MTKNMTCPLCRAEWKGWNGSWPAGDYLDHKGPSYRSACCNSNEWVFHAYGAALPTRPGAQGERPNAPLPPTGRERFGL